MKKKWIVLLILMGMMVLPLRAQAEPEYSEDFRYAVPLENSLLSDETDLNDPASVKEDLEFENFFLYLMEEIKEAWNESLETLIKGLSLVLLSVVMSRCCGNIQSQNMQMLFSFMVSISVLLLCEENLRTGAASLQKAIEDMGVFTAACIPSFSVVMIASGEAGGASVFSAAMVLLGEVGTIISKNLLLPLTDVYLAIGICSAVSDEYGFANVGKNIRRFLIWAIGLFALGFRTVMKLQTGAAVAGDQLARKYIRTAVGGFIPMVGNTLSQSVDGLFTVAAGIKSSFAIAGVLITLSLLLPALIPLAVNGLIWSICRWIADFLNDPIIRTVADVLANSFYLMLALGGGVGLMGLFSFFGLITQVG